MADHSEQGGGSAPTSTVGGSVSTASASEMKFFHICSIISDKRKKFHHTPDPMLQITFRMV